MQFQEGNDTESVVDEDSDEEESLQETLTHQRLVPQIISESEGKGSCKLSMFNICNILIIMLFNTNCTTRIFCLILYNRLYSEDFSLF